jgi:hypothetical protein
VNDLYKKIKLRVQKIQELGEGAYHSFLPQDYNTDSDGDESAEKIPRYSIDNSTNSNTSKELMVIASKYAGDLVIYVDNSSPRKSISQRKAISKTRQKYGCAP